MRLSNRELTRRIEAIEATRGDSVRTREVVRRLDIRPHIADCYLEVHDDITQGNHTFYNFAGGRGSGKSSFISLEIVNQIMKDSTGRKSALVVRKFATTLRGSVFHQIQWAIDQLGVSEHWKSTFMPLQFVYETGQVIRFSGLDDPTKLKSLKPAAGYFSILWIEEFSEITGEPELRNLQQSVLRGGDRFIVLRSFNPPISTANWVNQYVDRPDERSQTIRTDYRQIPAEWLGSVFLEEAERLKAINPRAYEHEFLGIPTGSGSEVFPALEVREITDDEIQEQVYVYQGLDFGFSVDPAAFVRVSYDRKRDTIFVLDEIYVRGIGNRELADRIKDKGYDRTGTGYVSMYQDWIEEKQVITCDSAEPKSIQDLRDQGLKARACHKFPGCVQYRIRWLQHRKVVVDPMRTPETARELQNYCYEVDRRTGEVTAQLPDKDNHTIDALAYALDRLIYRKGIPA